MTRPPLDLTAAVNAAHAFAVAPKRSTQAAVAESMRQAGAALASMATDLRGANQLLAAIARDEMAPSDAGKVRDAMNYLHAALASIGGTP